MALRRRDLDGMWDRLQTHGPITGSGPNFESAMRKFRKRQARLKEVGVWRCGRATWKKNNGTYIDQDWDFVDY